VREFIVGTGGAGLSNPGAQQPTSEALNAQTHGVIRIPLRNGSYDWSFVPDEGTFTDSGTGGCHAAPPGPDTVAPTTTAACNGVACGTGPYAPGVAVTLTCTDNTGGSGVASTRYTLDGTDPTTTSTLYTAAVPLSATTTVKYRSWDVAGNAEATKSQLVSVDNAAPVTSMLCNGNPCVATGYSSPPSVSFTSADINGLGVASTHYTTDGTDPTLASPTYTAAFPVTATRTVKFRSWDKAGNVEATRSQVVTVTVDSPPVAALSLSASSGVAPFAVTADASRSTDTDPTPIVSYTFTFGDGTAAVTQAGATATHTYAAAGTFTVTVTAKDSAGLTGSATAQVVSKQNILNNATFESNTSGWAGGTNSTLARVAGGHSGSWSARVTNSARVAATSSMSDSPNRVNKTSAGTYTASMWVKGAVAGKPLTLTLTELAGTTVVGTGTATVTLSTSWQLVTVTYTVKQPGKTGLDLTAAVAGVPALTTAFFADDATLVLG
jgi:PKD repeat protein